MFHLLKRCRELLETAVGGAVRFPRAVADLLQQGLDIRDRYLADDLTLRGVRGQGTRLMHRLDELVSRVKTHAGNERLAKFLQNHLADVFCFLQQPDAVSATNNESEFELRFNVIARKLSGGNRSEFGVRAQETLPSVIRTCRKNDRDPFHFLVQTLRNTNTPTLITKPNK